MELSKTSIYEQLSSAVEVADSALEQIEFIFASMQASSTQAWLLLKPFDFSLKSARALCGLLKKESPGIIDIVLGVSGTALHGARAYGYDGLPVANSVLKVATAGKKLYNSKSYRNSVLAIASGLPGFKPLKPEIGKVLNKIGVAGRVGTALSKQSNKMTIKHKKKSHKYKNLSP